MTKHDRYKLLFGPYKAPLVKYGRIVFCEARGDMVVRGLSAGRIPWPLGIKRKERNRSLLLIGDLVKAVRRESNGRNRSPAAFLECYTASL